MLPNPAFFLRHAAVLRAEQFIHSLMLMFFFYLETQQARYA